MGRLLAGEGPLGEPEPVPVRGQGHVGVGHFGQERDAGPGLGLLGGEVLLQGPVLEAADAAEEVQLPGGDAHRGAVLLGDHGLARGGHAGGNALAVAHGGGVDGGQQLGPLDAVGGPHLLGGQGGHAQVAVLGQREVEDLPQALVHVEVPPGNVGGRVGGPRRGFGGLRPLVGGGAGRHLVPGRHGHAAAHGREHEEGKALGRFHHCASPVDPVDGRFFANSWLTRMKARGM